MKNHAGRWTPILIALVLLGGHTSAADTSQVAGIFAKKNLVAWCVVPFDAKKRGPKARAKMLHRLGLAKLAYDWRGEHVPTFEEEIQALKEQDIELFAFWGEHEEMFRLFEKHSLTPQVWKTVPSPKKGTQSEKVTAAGRQLLPLARRTERLNCKLGLYNHGGWGGQPENLVAVCRWLREKAAADRVGIVYNFHHGHEHLGTFPKNFKLMVPYLLCTNLNGMTRGGAKILPLGKGKEDLRVLKMIRQSSYQGPIGILDHRQELDAQQSLKQNLDGLETLLRQMK